MSIRVINLETGEETQRDYTAEELAAIEARQPNNNEVISAKLAQIKQVRELILNRLVGIALAAGLTGDDATTAAYVTVRQALLDITKNLPTDPEQVDLAVMTRYAAIVAECTPQMVTAFAEMDL